jgi:hypothetical protein
VVLVRRVGSHSFPHTGRGGCQVRPAFRAALQQTVRRCARRCQLGYRWPSMRPIAGTDPAGGARHHARLYQRLLRAGGGSELRRGWLWRRFEPTGCVVTMSERIAAVPAPAR